MSTPFLSAPASSTSLNSRPIRYIRMAWGGLVANMPNGQAYDDFVRSKGTKRKEERIKDKFDAGDYTLVEYFSAISRWVGS